MQPDQVPLPHGNCGAATILLCGEAVRVDNRTKLKNHAQNAAYVIIAVHIFIIYVSHEQYSRLQITPILDQIVRSPFGRPSRLAFHSLVKLQDGFVLA